MKREYQITVDGKTVQRRRKTFTSALRHEVFKCNKYKCVECGATNKERILHIDHIIPICQGGTDELDNMQTLCAECNFAKSGRIYNSLPTPSTTKTKTIIKIVKHNDCLDDIEEFENMAKDVGSWENNDLGKIKYLFEKLRKNNLIPQRESVNAWHKAKEGGNMKLADKIMKDDTERLISLGLNGYGVNFSEKPEEVKT